MGAKEEVSGVLGGADLEAARFSVCNDFFEHVVKSQDMDGDLRADRETVIDVQTIVRNSKNQCFGCGLIIDMFQVVGQPLSDLVVASTTEEERLWKVEARYRCRYQWEKYTVILRLMQCVSASMSTMVELAVEPLG
jgi:hypothetical protein